MDKETELVGQAGSELFNEAEVKTKRSENTGEVQKSGRQFSSVSGIKEIAHWKSLREKQMVGTLTKNDKRYGPDRKA